MKDIQQKSDPDLYKLLKEKRTELQQFRFGMTGSKTRDVKRGRMLRREIARILTELNARRAQS